MYNNLGASSSLWQMIVGSGGDDLNGTGSVLDLSRPFNSHQAYEIEQLASSHPTNDTTSDRTRSIRPDWYSLFSHRVIVYRWTPLLILVQRSIFVLYTNVYIGHKLSFNYRRKHIA